MPRIERRQSLTLRLLLYTVLSCLAPFILPLKFLLMRKLAFDFTACTTRHRIEIWACNATLQPLPARLEIEVCPLAGGNVRRISRDVVLHANGSTELHIIVLSHSAGNSIVFARLLGDDAAVLARYSDWPQPFVALHCLFRRIKCWRRYKFLDVQTSKQAGLAVVPTSKQGKVKVTTRLPIKGLVFDQDVDDNALDLCPGEERFVEVEDASTLTWRHLGSKCDEG
jgi:beta-mannosidase